MIILSRKKILLTLGIIATIIFTYTITSYNVNTSSKKEIESIQTVALPVDNKVIVIDAGHGVPDEGAESSSRNYRSRK